MFNFILPQFFIKVEKWKWNKEYRIYVSNLGHFKNEHKQDLPIRIGNKNGYCGIIVPNYGFRNAHRLVMITWKPIPDAENLTIDHLDHNKRNNAVDNLEWITKEENWNRAQADLYDEEEINTDSKPKIQMGFHPSQPMRYQGGKTIFNSLDEAAKFCMKHSGPDLTLEKAKQQIKIKCQSGAKYCGRKWKEIK